MTDTAHDPSGGYPSRRAIDAQNVANQKRQELVETSASAYRRLALLEEFAARMRYINRTAGTVMVAEFLAEEIDWLDAEQQKAIQ